MNAWGLLFACSACAGACSAFGVQASAPAPTGPVTNCVTADCHGDVVSGSVLHGPAARRKCEACHTLVDARAHYFAPSAPEDRLCELCHVQSERTFVHKPVADRRCTECHDPHGSDRRYMLVEDPAGGLCFQCHDAQTYEQHSYVHGPVAAGACIVCHEAHSSWRPELLVKQAPDLCFLCHDAVSVDLELSRHPHEPAVRGQCLVCHDAHASDHVEQLHTDARPLCFSCHKEIERIVETSAHVHGALTTDESCLSCHTGHGGPLPKLLARPLLSLCLACHDQAITTPDGRRLTDMGALLRDNPDQHGPVRRADCSACHNPHASPNFDLLVKEYPETFYAPFDLKTYDLCFSCHLKELVTSEDGEGVTGFRDGDRNLHYVHVHREEKGRTCRACHEVHASKKPFHIRDKVPFGAGGWELEVNFEPLPDGGRCAPGCHVAETYHRGPVRSESGFAPRARSTGNE